MTLQVPEYVGDAHADDELIVVAPEHLERLSGQMVPSKNGCLFFSRAGYEHHKSRLKVEFKSSGRGSWADFERAAEEHFQTVIRGLEKKVKQAEKDARRWRTEFDKRTEERFRAYLKGQDESPR